MSVTSRWVLGSISCAAIASSASAQSFSGIGDLPGGAVDSGAYGISADGSTVVGGSASASGYEAVRWIAGALTPLGDVAGGAVQSYAMACNFDGTIIVGTGVDASVHRPLRWDGTSLSVLPQVPGFPAGAVVHGISADGRTIVGYDTDGDTSGYNNVTAYRIDDGVITGLLYWSGNHYDSAPSGVPSADGQVIAGRILTPANDYQACYWSGTTLHPLAKLLGGSNFSQGFGVSGDGLVVVGVSASASSNGGAFTGEPCRWVGAQPFGLGDLPGGTFSGRAYAANSDGSLIVGECDTAAGMRAFVWDGVRGMRDLESVLESDYGLDLTGWELRAAYAISPDGSAIVGSGTNPSGANEGWIARLSCGTTWAYCTSGTTSHGCAASISASGTPSASSSSGFVLTATGVEGDKQGLFFYGLSGAQAVPWGASASFLCVKSPTQRMPVITSGGTSGACDGVLASDWNAFRAAHPTALGSPFLGGELVGVQAWFRDPPSVKTTSLSNALSFTVCP